MIDIIVNNLLNDDIASFHDSDQRVGEGGVEGYDRVECCTGSTVDMKV